MKLLILLLLSSIAAAQPSKKDTSWTPTDSTEFITIKSINERLKDWEDKLTFKEFTLIRNAFETVINAEIERKRKKKSN